MVRAQEAFSKSNRPTLGDKCMDVDLKRFSQSGTRTIYDFFDLYKRAYKGLLLKERARVLVKTYLDFILVKEDDYLTSRTG